ncbi:MULTISPECIES: lysozyme [unclassified Streptomyces]|uniref:lysozyme n=1 Tax=unclassified Streptomyces TaxID=2593676 RepID=UPI002E31CCAD|nr:lysozyme [Streptomyces sp. NBC_01428]
MARDHHLLRRRSRAAVTAVVAALTVAGAALAALPAQARTPAEAERPPRSSSRPHGGVRGHDVSSHQKDVDWRSAKAKGAGFVYVKATESTAYRNPYFTRQYDGAGTAGLLRGAYHFAVPDKSSGTDQAAYFVRNGGAWRADGRTLPPALDIEYDPYARRRSCYGLRPAAMVRWIREFSDEVERETGRTPVIYTTAHWWNTCTGSSRAFAARHALWLARYGAADPGALPAGWSTWTFWQYDTTGGLPGDQDLFHGSPAGLERLARG